MKIRILGMATCLLLVLVAGCAHPVVVYSTPPPPAAFSEIARHGYHDGFEAARRDVARNLPPGVDKHPKFRNPPVPPPAFEDYRHGFREGYEAFLHNGRGPVY